MRKLLLLLLLQPVAACRSTSPSLTAAVASVQLGAQSVDFGNVYVQASPVRTLAVLNAGDATDKVSVLLIADGGVFSIDAGTFELAGGASFQLPVTFAPLLPGSYAGVAQVRWSADAGVVALSGTGLAWPPCAPSGPCAEASFDPTSATCTQGQLADGTLCDAGLVCLTQTECVGGICLGTPVDCDAGSVCSTGYCVEGEGCHLEDTSARCDGTDPCQVYACDPQKGCVSTAAADGTPCGSEISCQSGAVCLAGTCVGVPLPNGTPCSLTWAPCVTDAVCDAGVCDSATADLYQPGQVLWTFAFDAGSAAVATIQAVDPDGTSYVHVAPQLNGQPGAVVSLDRCGQQLWTQPFDYDYGLVAFLDGPQLVTFQDEFGELQGLSTVLGSSLWSLSVTQATTGASEVLDSLPVLNNQEQIFVPFDLGAAPTAAYLATVYTNGTLDWVQALPASGDGGFPGGLSNGDPNAADGLGNTYQWADPAPPFSGALASFDSTGRLRFQLPAPPAPFPQIAVGVDYVLIPGSGAWSLDGSPRYALTDVGDAVIDGQGDAYLAGQASLYKLDADGQPLWTDAVLCGPLALGNANTLFCEPANGGVSAYDSQTGQQLWQSDAGSQGPLFLSSAAMLLTSGSNASVTALFAGPNQQPATAPWARDRGDNTNRGCPPASSLGP